MRVEDRSERLCRGRRVIESFQIAIPEIFSRILPSAAAAAAALSTIRFIILGISA